MLTDWMVPESSTQLDADNEAFFEQTFKKNFKGLTHYALTIVKDEVMAEEIVQNMFVRLWEKRDQVSINESVTGISIARFTTIAPDGRLVSGLSSRASCHHR